MIAGGLDLSHLPDSLEDNPEYARYAELAEGRGLLKVELSADRSADGIALEVRTSNHRSAHRFPIGPFDLQEVWMEVTVRHQRSGAVLAHVGGLSDGPGDPAPPPLGAPALPRNGWQKLEVIPRMVGNNPNVNTQRSVTPRLVPKS